MNKPIKTRALVPMGHEFYLDDDDIDPFFTSHGYHNGPGCALCHDVWCHHCTPEIYTEQCPAAIAQAKLPTGGSLS